jgi:hypothetical protein
MRRRNFLLLIGATSVAPVAAKNLSGSRSLKEAEFEIRGMT